MEKIGWMFHATFHERGSALLWQSPFGPLSIPDLLKRIDRGKLQEIQEHSQLNDSVVKTSNLEERCDAALRAMRRRLVSVETHVRESCNASDAARGFLP
jgi:hypothetical protein